jgi:hypothetical protein
MGGNLGFALNLRRWSWARPPAYNATPQENLTMAWLEQHPTSHRFKLCFRSGERKYKKTLKTTQRKDAEGILARFEENLDLLQRDRLELPEGADLMTFLRR